MSLLFYGFMAIIIHALKLLPNLDFCVADHKIPLCDAMFTKNTLHNSNNNINNILFYDNEKGKDIIKINFLF